MDKSKYFNPKTYKCWMFPALPQVSKTELATNTGKAAVLTALCLYSFFAPAFGQTGQAPGRIVHLAPGQGIFVFQSDTMDTNALPAFFRALGCDSACAIQRTAAILMAMQTMEKTEELDIRLQRDLQGVGLRHYAWFRRWIMQVADDRAEYLD
jgi:hypothetical protein